MTKKEYTEKEYWEGKVPDELFDEYLNKYGYEYTPTDYSQNPITLLIMALSEQTLDHLLEAEGSIRAAIKCSAVNEKPLVVTQLSKLLYDLDQLKEFEKLQDIVDAHMQNSNE